MSDTTTKRKLEAALSMARATVLLLEDELAVVETSALDALLSTAQTLAQYGLGHEAVRAAAERGELAVQRGSRGKYLVLESELRRYLASRPLRPTPRRASPPDLDGWEVDADRVLQLVGSRR